LEKLNGNGKLKIAEKEYSPVDFGITFNADYPKKLAQNGISLLQACTGSTPSLAIVRNTLGEKTIELVIEVWLDRLNDFYGKGSLSPLQIEEVSTLIIAEYYYLKIAELAVFFNKFKIGRYGEFYGAIDPLKIMSALIEFVSERKEELTRYDRAIEKQRNEDERQKRDEEFKKATWYKNI
jgi:hypothetical protein